jgi:hypothetical protein
MSRVFQSPRTVRTGLGLGLGLRGAVVVAGLLAGASACVEQAEEKPTNEDLDFIKKNKLSTAPTPQFAVNADMDGKVVYLGLDSSMNPIEPGKDVKITHYWKVVNAPGQPWRNFVHLSGPNHQGYINVDHGPMHGKYPVSQWKNGDILKDEHVIRLPPTWPHDKVLVFAGLWHGKDRMPIKAGPNVTVDDGRLLAATIPVTVKAPAAVAKVPPKRYVVRKTSKPIKLDGKLDEQAWKDAPSTGVFVNTLTGGGAETKTEAKMLWDNDNLYVAFENVDSDVWSTLSKRDDKLWSQEMVELMIDANRDGKSYIELQVAPNGNIFDTYLPTYRKYEDTMTPPRKQYSWDSKVKASVKVDGTLNKRGDKDTGWTVELALPLIDAYGLAAENAKVPPVLGETWRLNMFRMDAPEGKSQQASGWSPPLVSDFHALDRFGEIAFGDEKGEVPAPKTAEIKLPPGAHLPPGMRESIAAHAAALGKAEKPGDDKATAKADKAEKTDKAEKPAKKTAAVKKK